MRIRGVKWDLTSTSTIDLAVTTFQDEIVNILATWPKFYETVGRQFAFLLTRREIPVNTISHSDESITRALVAADDFWNLRRARRRRAIGNFLGHYRSSGWFAGSLPGRSWPLCPFTASSNCIISCACS